GAKAAARTAGIELVTWRGRALAGATPGTGNSQTSCGRSWLSPIATSPVPSAVKPTLRPTPRHGVTTRPPPAATVAGGVLRARAGTARLDGRGARDRCDDEIDQAVVDVVVDEPAAVGGRQRGIAEAARRLAVLAVAAREHGPRLAVGREPDDLEPAARVGEV